MKIKVFLSKGGIDTIKNVQRLSIENGQYRFWTDFDRHSFIEEQVERVEVTKVEDS